MAEEWALAASAFSSGLASGLLGMLSTLMRPMLAALDGRDFVIPDDVQALAGPVLAHRLLPTSEAMVERELPERVLSRLVERLPLPLK